MLTSTRDFIFLAAPDLDKLFKSWSGMAGGEENEKEYLHRGSDRPGLPQTITFSEVDMSSFVCGAGGGLEVTDQGLDTLLCGGEQVDGLHAGHGLSGLLKRLHNYGQGTALVFATLTHTLTCDSLSRQLVHLDAGGHHLDGELVHHQHSPVHLVSSLVVADDVIKDS